MSDWPETPFVGLRPFRTDEALLFFGRRQQATELLKALHKTHFLPVIGSSGCGKSSLIQAGLIPRLRGGFLVEDRDVWMFRAFTPGDAPRARLASAFGVGDTVIQEQGASAIVSSLVQQQNADSQNCLVLVDQFEEIFSFTGAVSNRDEAADFVALLLALAAQRQFPVFVVLTMRSDFLGDCDVFHGLPEAINQSHYLVPRLTRTQRQEAMQGPVRLFGHTMSPQLLDRVLNDLGDDHDQLPVMQHAMLRTWEHWQRDGGQDPIDVTHYQDIGGVKEALSRDGDAALVQMSDDARRVAIRVFQALTDTDTNNRPVRRYVRLSDLARETGAAPAAVTGVIERFRESGRSFLVVREDAGSSDAVVHISHESLIRQWGSLRDWVDGEQQSRDQYLRLVDLAERHSRCQEGLLRDAGLQLALEWRDRVKPTAGWAERYRGDFTRAMTYLNDSEMLRDKERRDRESQHLRFLLVTGLAIAFIVMAAAAAVGWYYTTRQSKSRTIAYLASSETDLARALLYGTQAVSTSPTFEARSSLVTLLGRNPHLRKFLHGHSGLVTSVSFAPDGTFAASGSTDGRVLLWDVEAGTSRTLFEGGVPVHSVGFSPNGALLAAGLGDGSIALWDVKAGRPLQALRSNQKDVRSVAFSGDGDRLAAGTVDGTLVVWTGLAGTEGDHARATMEPVILTGGKNDVQSVAFSPSEPLLAASHWDGSIVLWELNRRRQRGELQHKPRAFSLAFTPDGQTLISGGDDTMIRAWNIADMKETFEKPLGGEAPVRSVAISRDGRLLAAAGDDRRIRMWEIAPGPSFQLQDIVPRSFEILHERPLHSVAFSPDGLRLLSGGEDKRVILWNVAQESLAERIIAQPHGASLQYLTWSSDGSELAWLDDDRHVVRWSLRTHTPEVGKATMPGATNASLNFDAGARLLWSGVSDHEFSRVDSSTGTKVGASVPLSGILTSSVAVSRDGRLLAYGVQSEKDAKGSYGIVVWDLEARGERRSIHTRGPVVALAMNAAGTKLASTSGANAVTLWNAATGAEVSQLTSADRSFRSLAFSTDGSHLAAGTFDRQRPEIIIWDLDVGRALGVLATGHHGSINSLSFGPDAYSIASADDDIDGTIRLWTLEPQAVQARACETANRDVTPDEWSVIVGPNAPRSGPCRR